MDFGFIKFLVSGATAGTVVDVALFPIDAIKTRMQSENGFWRSGGFYGIYRGIAPAAAGSAPTAAVFFWTYESCKQFLSSATGSRDSVIIHMVSASIAEVSACLIRVPVEIAKQRRQVLNSQIDKSALDILRTAFKENGVRKGLYRGYCSTLCREIPFSFIQFPLWEFLKFKCSARTGAPISPICVAACGAVAGGVSAAITTPLDVAKTRIMLCDETAGQRLGIRNILILIYNEKGVKGLFAGLVPRVMWITLGGAIFFGCYDLTLRQF